MYAQGLSENKMVTKIFPITYNILPQIVGSINDDWHASAHVSIIRLNTGSLGFACKMENETYYNHHVSFVVIGY